MDVSTARTLSQGPRRAQQRDPNPPRPFARLSRVRSPRIQIDVCLEPDEAMALMAEEVADGLARAPRELPSKYFYDARGSRLFERITRLPEYYLTRAEEALLETVSEEVARIAAPEDLVELGPGSARKTRRLLGASLAAGGLRRYLPVDVSLASAEASARELAAEYPGLAIHGVVGDFERHLDRVPAGGRKLVAFLGSTLGNFLRPRAEDFLSKVAGLLGEQDWFLLGTDLVKDAATLHAAYNDGQGITAEFNRNILRVVNRQLCGGFDPDAFDHVAFYDVENERIEMHLGSRNDQTVTLRAIDLVLLLKEGERIRTEVSCKYTRRSVEEILTAAGLRLEHFYAAGGFALSLSRRRGS